MLFYHPCFSLFNFIFSSLIGFVKFHFLPPFVYFFFLQFIYSEYYHLFIGVSNFIFSCRYGDFNLFVMLKYVFSFLPLFTGSNKMLKSICIFMSFSFTFINITFLVHSYAKLLNFIYAVILCIFILFRVPFLFIRREGLLIGCHKELYVRLLMS